MGKMWWIVVGIGALVMALLIVGVSSAPWQGL